MDRYDRNQVWSRYFEIALAVMCKQNATARCIADDAKAIADESMRASLEHDAEEDAREQVDMRRLILDAVKRTGGPHTRDEIEDRVKREHRKHCGEWDAIRFRDSLFVLLEKREIAVEVSNDGVARFDLEIPF